MRDQQFLDRMNGALRDGNFADALRLTNLDVAEQELSLDDLDGVAGGVITEANTGLALDYVYWTKGMLGAEKAMVDNAVADFFTTASDWNGATRDELQWLIDKFWAFDIKQLEEIRGINTSTSV